MQLSDNQVSLKTAFGITVNNQQLTHYEHTSFYGNKIIEPQKMP